MRRLAAGRDPVALLGHGLDHVLAVHRLSGLAQDFGRGVDCAELLGLGLGLLLCLRRFDGGLRVLGLGLLGLCFLGLWLHGLPVLRLRSLVALLFLAFGAVLVFFALIMHLRNDVSMGWLPSSGGGNHPSRRPTAFRHALSACMSYLAGARTSSVLRQELS